MAVLSNLTSTFTWCVFKKEIIPFNSSAVIDAKEGITA